MCDFTGLVVLKTTLEIWLDWLEIGTGQFPAFVALTSDRLVILTYVHLLPGPFHACATHAQQCRQIVMCLLTAAHISV